jgi:hypothetical protein
MGLPQVGTESIGEDPLQMPPEGITYNSGGRVVYTKKKYTYHFYALYPRRRRRYQKLTELSYVN